MKFSLSWLKEHLDTDADIHAVADCLNRIGLEVEGIENPADALSAFRVARVLSAAPSGRLRCAYCPCGHAWRLWSSRRCCPRQRHGVEGR